MNIGGLFGALAPVFFVLALGYLAGKRNAFDADQSAGLSKLALTFALPASPFVSVTEIRSAGAARQPRKARHGKELTPEQDDPAPTEDLSVVGSLARVTVQSAVLFALLHFLHVVSPFAREALVCCSLPLSFFWSARLLKSRLNLANLSTPIERPILNL